MNSSFFSLVKIEFQRFLSSLSTSGKKVRRMPIFYVGILLVVLVALASFGYTFIFLIPFVQEQADPSPVISIFAGLTSLLVFMSTLSQARSIYIGEDYDLLSSLPIRKRDIVASKVVSLYAIELFFSLIVMIPHGIAMLVFAHELSLFFIAILLAFTLPLIPLAIAIFISLLITILTARFKSANLVFVILYAIVIVGLSASIMIINNMDKSKAVSSFSTIGDIIKWINPSYYFVELSLYGDKINLLFYVLISIGVIIIATLFIVLLFDRLHEIVSSTRMKKQYVRKELKNKKEGRVLLSLELKRLISSKIYFINIIIGPLMLILGTAVFIISMNRPLSGASEEAARMIKIMVGPIYVAVAMVIMSIGTPTSAVINIEGKTFWIIKSLPISRKKLMWSKIFFSWILTMPAAIIASTIEVIFFHENIWEIFLVYLLPLLFVILSSFIGLIMAIKHPKLKWNSEAEAVKNAITILLSTLINFGITIVLTAVLIAIPIAFPNIAYTAYLITLLALIIGIIPSYIYLHKNFSKKIDQMEDM